MSDRPDPPQPPPKRNADREARLAKNLRENLRRRKAVTRARDESERDAPKPGEDKG